MVSVSAWVRVRVRLRILRIKFRDMITPRFSKLETNLRLI